MILFFWITSSHRSLGQTEFKEVSFEQKTQSKRAKYFLTGQVNQLETGEPLSGVSIHIDGFFAGDNTDKNGQYAVSLDSGRHRIVFRQLGKKPSHYIALMYGDGQLDVGLANLDFELEAFTVQAEERDRNIRSPITGVTKMNINDIKLVPAFLGEPDVFNVLQSMPGVTSVGEGSAGMNIRGGQADQNLIMMNETIVLSNSHALGFLSSFNGDALQNFTLYKGTVPSYFGGRSSSALNIEMRKGNKEKWKGSGSIGTAVSKLMIEGPIVPEKTSMIFASRLSNANWLLNQANEVDVQNSKINFHDIYLGVNHQFSEKNSLDFNLLNTGDYFRFSDQFGFEWNNLVGSLTSRNLLTDDLSLVGMVAYGSFNNGFFEPSPIDPSKIENGLYYFQGKVTGLWTLEKVDVNFGAEAIQYQMRPEKQSPLSPESGIPYQTVSKERGMEYAPFVSADWNPSENFSLSGGLRYSNYVQQGPDSVFRYEEGLPISRLTIVGVDFIESGNVVRYNGFEPRLSFRWTFDASSSIKGGYSVMNQYLQTISNATGPTPIDLWQLSTTYILPQRSHNASLGYFRNFQEDEWSTSFEGFYRTTANQLEYRNFADLFVNPHIETELIQGEGMAYGAEVLIQKNSGGITGWLAYTYSRSLIRTTSEFPEIQVNQGNWFATNFDKPHNISLVTNFHIGRGRTFNTNVNFSSGRPVTGLSSNYVIGGIFVPNFGNRNEFRIPNYFRIDFSYLTNGFVRKWDDKINFSVYNLTGRRNAYSVFFQREGRTPRLVPYQISILGSAFPSFTYTVAFGK
ncbi:TonB-dependent receptor [Aquiflexum sp. TKW24L]|uniref:TonB-dependent receptor n=1 Tax=Aquiflexum sp. TKW24L TaxID=2942212 RepID=UPI0020BE3F41|nr:TonB-dependent receptor [Aquiflexum sp. TKW24L]MCL6257895.1 TonB-dependent receptor [Aquiflexum sp. TKW24L]